MENSTTRQLTTWQRAKAAGIAALAYPLIALLGVTLRWRISGIEHLDEIRNSGRQPVMAFWHGRILSATYYFRRRGIVVITSENFDGEWIARIIERFGYGTARGSSSHGGQRALIRLKRALAEGKAAGFTVDGPRGPAGCAQPGAVWTERRFRSRSAGLLLRWARRSMCLKMLMSKYLKQSVPSSSRRYMDLSM